MKSRLFSYIFFGGIICSFSVKAQQYCQVPDSVTQTATTIANFINAQPLDELEKVTCAYHWVIQHLVYDADSMYSFIVGDNDSLLVASTLRRRRGVCENYAGLLVAIFKAMKVEAMVVKGYVKENNKLRRAGHSWVAFQHRQQWWLCDPTWENSASAVYIYWMKKGEDLITTHMPFDPIWQLLPDPWRYDDFNKGIRRADVSAKNWQFNDSIAVMLRATDSANYSAAYRRIRENGTPNLLVKTWTDYLAMKMAIEFEKRDELVYRKIVDCINEVTFTYNQYAEWRNANLFMPAQIQFWKNNLHDALQKLSSAKTQTSLIGKELPNPQYDTGYMIERIQILFDKCKMAESWVATLKLQ